MNDIAVVTAVTGDYDYGFIHTANHRKDVDYIYFTDGKSYPLDDHWKVSMLPTGVTEHPCKLAKIPKINPHSIPELCNYKYVIWIDGSMQIISNLFINDILSYLDNGLVLSPHFDGRNCGYSEATIRPPKYAVQDLDGQCDFYRSQNFPENYGLYEAGVQARDMSAPGVKEFGEIWMQQVLDWTTQDQVSCGYSLWKSGLVPDVLDKSWRDYGWIHINAHLRDV